jgi:type II secretory pathway component PulF
MQSAGVGLVDFFQTLYNSEKNEDRKKKLRFVVENLKKGRPLASTLKQTGLLPVYDIPLIESGEKSGTLTRVCDILAKNHQMAADSLKHVINGLKKPLFTFAAALFIPPFPDLFTEKITLKQYLVQGFGTLGVVVLIFYFLYRLFMNSFFDLQAARLRHKILLFIPFVRDLAKKSVLETFCSSLAIMLEAGLPIYDALMLAGQTSAEPEISDATQRIVKLSKSGMPLPQAFQKEEVFSDEIKNSVALGTASGKIPMFLDRTAKSLKKDVDMKFHNIMKAIPVTIYWMVVLYVLWVIVGFYIVRMTTLDQIMSGGN